MPSVNMPRMPRPAMPRAMKLPEISDEMKAPLTLFAALGLAAVLSIVIAIGVAVMDDDRSGDGIVAGASETPTESEPTPEGETPSASGPAETTPAETAPAESPPPVVVPPSPQGSVAAALWSNVRNEWWFGDLGTGSGNYAEGELLPVLATWAANPGQTYDVSITYDCATDDAFGAIDYLTGIDTAGTAPLLAAGGPGRDRPDAAIPVPDTADFAPDDGTFGVAFLFGGRFAGLPASPQPSGDCDRQRTLSLQVLAESAQVQLLLSGHLATAAVWGVDEGAASHDPPFGVDVTVVGLGSARVNVTPDAVIDIE